MYMNASNLLETLHQNRPKAIDASVLLGFTEDEAIDWAISNDVELDVDEAPADYAHLIGIVLSAMPADDGRVAIVVGQAHPDMPAEVVVVDEAESDHDDVDELDAFFATTAAENEQLAEPARYEDDVWELPESDETDEAIEIDEGDRPQEVTEHAQPTSKRRPRLLAACLAVFVVLGVFSLLLSLSEPSGTAPAAPAPVVSTQASPAPPKATPSPAVKRPARSKARSSKRRRARARRSTPQAAPRPVVPVTRPAAPVGGGSCGSAASEMTFEC